MDQIGRLGDPFSRFGHLQGDLDRIRENLFGKRSDFWGHGGTEHQGLPILWQKGDDLHDVFVEPDVQHPVGFIQNKMLYLIKPDISLRKMTDQLSRCSHDNVGPFGKGYLLLPPFTSVTSPVNGNRGDVEGVRQPLNLLVYLNSQLPGGNQNQRIGVG